jgi:spore maturation protein B
VDIADALRTGAGDGLKTVVSIIPSLVMMLTVIYMLRASGALDMLITLLEPAARLVGIPAECLPLVLMRPLSGSGALAIGAELISAYGADSLVGRTAAVMLGSTETTFYVISVYFGAANIKNTRRALPAALIADAVGFCAAALTVRLFWR